MKFSTVALSALTAVAAAGPIVQRQSLADGLDKGIKELNNNLEPVTENTLDGVNSLVGDILMPGKGTNEAQNIIYDANSQTAKGVKEVLNATRDYINSILQGDLTEERGNQVIAEFNKANKDLSGGLSTLLNGVQDTLQKINENALDLGLFPEEVQKYFNQFNGNTSDAATELVQAVNQIINSIFYNNGASPQTIQNQVNQGNTDLTNALEALLKGVNAILNSAN
ncbi:hypothetical protein E3P77_02990 [Wallemia ichthyophaga]|uniref:Uncharacterized protein n=1 Tax=Wallemia ichthyophaga TaxID=245174 RepID=A0A4V6TNA5_WALIC|nr:hypothetical protein E3P90_02627 [Wallemia ichthyophaga]TIB11168.1 hypothetical protein E3P93_02635 [Wallemia ichthyophaga]TIB21404.1 hypothetical protein E3P89_02611 [Wallemia ichthyophaga]TIB23170.1 hypothetical protein E3P88_02646 [Wallemia ichthyophaga]TIB64850.1 hypothetical protein E3P77_02990 [Wallemia ichthyophaga]